MSDRIINQSPARRTLANRQHTALIKRALSEVILVQLRETHQSRKTLAERAAISRTHLQRVVATKKLPRLDVFWRISEAIGLGPEKTVRHMKRSLNRFPED